MDDLWYLRDLLAYMLGVRREEVDELVRRYVASGGPRDAAALFAFLSAHGRRYSVLWGIVPHGDSISILLVAVVAPDHSVVWWASKAVPYGRDSGSLNLWNRVLELAAGASALVAPKVSESDFWSAEQVARQFAAVWPSILGGIYGEAVTSFGLVSKGENAPPDTGSILLEDPDLTRRIGNVVGQRMREVSGRPCSLAALRLVLVSLPELREMGLSIGVLQHAVDGYVQSTLNPAVHPNPAEGGHADAATLILPRTEVRDLEPVIEPVVGIPLSDVSPGDLLLFRDIAGDEPIVGRVYMIRILRNGHYELHGRVEKGDGEGFFRYVAPGDIKVAPGDLPPPEEKKSSRWILPVAVVAAALIFIYLY